MSKKYFCPGCQSEFSISELHETRYPGLRLHHAASDNSFAAIEERAAHGLCGICGNNSFVIEHGHRRCAMCHTEKLVGYKCPGCHSTSGIGDGMGGCAFCGQPLIESEMKTGIVKKLYDVGFNVHIAADNAAFMNRERLRACAAALGKPVDDLELFQVSADAQGNFWQSDKESGVVCTGHLWPNAIYLFPLYATNPPRTYIFAR